MVAIAAMAPTGEARRKWGACRPGTIDTGDPARIPSCPEIGYLVIGSVMNGVLFSPLNTVVLFVYLASMLGIGVYFSRKQKSTHDFFLAGRKMHWLIVSFSMFASLTSAVTYMGVPAMAYSENISMVVVCVVSPLLVPVLVVVFYPFYQRLKVTTSYEYVGQRFGYPARTAVSALFILARLGWLGTVIYAPSVALSVVTGIPEWQAILMMGLIATGYTALGGVSADIWSDLVQFAIMLIGAGWIVWSLAADVPGGVGGIVEAARASGNLKVFQWKFSLYEMTGIVVAVSFFFQMMQDYGTDQTTVQRLMATPTLKGIRKAIIVNAAVDFLFIGTLLFIGVGLFAYYSGGAAMPPEGLSNNHLLPYYIIHALPDGVSGLLVTAILAAAMSSMDSGVSSLSTVVINDFVRPMRGAGRPDSELSDLRLARVLTFAFGALGTLTAFYVSSFEHIIEAYTSIISLFNGPVLALFLLGMLTRRGTFAGWLAGSGLALLCTAYLQYVVKAHWTYYFPCSFGVAIAGGYLFSLVLPKRPAAATAGLTLWDRGKGRIAECGMRNAEGKEG